MNKTQQYWAERQEQKIENLEHDWKELGSMHNGEEEDKFTILIPVYHKPPKDASCFYIFRAKKNREEK